MISVYRSSVLPSTVLPRWERSVSFEPRAGRVSPRQATSCLVHIPPGSTCLQKGEATREARGAQQATSSRAALCARLVYNVHPSAAVCRNVGCLNITDRHHFARVASSPRAIKRNDPGFTESWTRVARQHRRTSTILIESKRFARGAGLGAERSR